MNCLKQNFAQLITSRKSFSKNY